LKNEEKNDKKINEETQPIFKSSYLSHNLVEILNGNVDVEVDVGAFPQQKSVGFIEVSWSYVHIIL